MRLRLVLLKDLIVRPLIVGVGLVLAVLGNIDTIRNWVAPKFSPKFQQIIQDALMSEIIRATVDWLANNWLILILLLLIGAVFEGFFQRTRRFLGEKVKADRILLVTREERPLNGDLYAWIGVENNENNDLEDCYAELRTIKIQDGDMWLDFTQRINPNLSKLTWPAFEDQEKVVVRRESKARLNIAKTDGTRNVAFTLRIGDTPGIPFKYCYYVEVDVNGIIQGKPIEKKIFLGFLIFISRLIQERDRPPSAYYRLYLRLGKLVDGKAIYEEQEGVTGNQEAI